MTDPEIEFPEFDLDSLPKKTAGLFAKMREKLTRAEEKILAAMKTILTKIRRYWQFLILTGRILILVVKKIREKGYLNCEKS